MQGSKDSLAEEEHFETWAVYGIQIIITIGEYPRIVNIALQSLTIWTNLNTSVPNTNA
jgi:hypothetical protein